MLKMTLDYYAWSWFYVKDMDKEDSIGNCFLRGQNSSVFDSLDTEIVFLTSNACSNN